MLEVDRVEDLAHRRQGEVDSPRNGRQRRRVGRDSLRTIKIIGSVLPVDVVVESPIVV